MIESDKLMQMMSLCGSMTLKELEQVASYVFKLAVAKSYEQGKEEE